VNDADRQIPQIATNTETACLWFGVLHTIHYFITFCKIVKTGTACVESSYLAGLRLWDLKKIMTLTPALG